MPMATSHLLNAAETVSKALAVLAAKGPGVFLAESRLRVRMRLPRRYVWCDGCRFDVKLLPPKVLRSLLADSYETYERLALQALCPTLPLIECGGGLGIVACLANRRLQYPLQHVVVEANPALLPVLSRQAALNGCQYQIVEAAIGYNGPTTEFFVCENPLASSRERRSPRRIEVRTVTLNSLLEPYGRANVICDIEGAEIELIEQEHAAWSKVETLILELHEQVVGAERTRAALTILQQRHGFRLSGVYNDVVVLTAGTPRPPV